jgi:hypothetical protein
MDSSYHWRRFAVAILLAAAVRLNAEVVDVKYRGNQIDRVVITLPVLNETKGLRLGDGVSFAYREGENIEKEISTPATSVFKSEWVAAHKDQSDSIQQFVVNLIEDLDIYQLTRKSSLAVNVSVGGYWGSASASYNESKFQDHYKEKLTAQASMQTDAETIQLRTEGIDLESFVPDVKKLILDARAAVDANRLDQLQELRRTFRLNYGTCYMALENKGARLVLEASRKLDTNLSIDKQKTTFRAEASGMNTVVADAKASAQKTKETKEFVKKSNLQMRAFLQGADGTIPLNPDRDTIWEYINQGISKSGWVAAARANPTRLTTGIVPFASVPALSILAYTPRGTSTLGGSRELSSVYPIMDGIEKKDYSAVATFLQYATGWGAVSYAFVPLPIPTGEAYVDREKGIVNLPVQMYQFNDITMRNLRAAHWKKITEKELDVSNKIFYQGIDSPNLLGSATITFEIDYEASGYRPEINRMKVTGGGGPRTSTYPPEIQELYNSYPAEPNRPDAYSFRFEGTPEAVDEFLKLAGNGVNIRPVLDVGGLQQIRLSSFKLKIAGNRKIEQPKRIEAPGSSQALRKLQELQDTTVSQDMLRMKKQVKVEARNSPLKSIAQVPGFSKIRAVASGLFNTHDAPPKFPPDFEGGHLQYFKGGKNPATAGYVWTWDNNSATAIDITARIFDRGNSDNNTGAFVVDVEVAPLGVPFGPLPEGEQRRQAEKERVAAEKAPQ